MFAVDWQQRLALAVGFGRDQFSGDDQTFLVGQAHGLSGLDGLVGGFESGDAYDGADDEIDLGMGRHADRAGGAVYDLDLWETGCSESGSERIGVGFVGDGDDPRLPAQRLLQSQFSVFASGESRDLEAVGITLDHAQSAASDGAGRTQDGDAFHAGMLSLYFTG